MQKFSSKSRVSDVTTGSQELEPSAFRSLIRSLVARGILTRAEKVAFILAAFCLFWSGRTARTATAGLVSQAQTYCAGSSPCVTTFHNDNNRDGVNPYESTLTVATVSTGVSVKFTQTVDGQIYAQPLFIGGLFVNGVSHNVVFVATENNTIYAIDGDAGGILWSTSLNTPGETAVPYTDLPQTGGQPCVNIVPEVGITGTPVIDTSVTPPVLYVASKNKESNGTWVQKLHALTTDTGSELTGSPFDVASHVTGFNALNQLQRTGLALSHDSSGNAIVYVAWGSHCDAGVYGGSIVGFNYNYTSASFSVVGAFNPQGNTGRKGGIWMSGGAPALDGNGNLYLATGDGKWSGTSNPTLVANSVVKLQQNTNTLTLADYYTPNDQLYLTQGTVGTGIQLSCGTGCTISNLPNNSDLGSGGVTLLQPSGISLAAPELTAAGKEGEIYVVDYQPSSNGVMGGLDGCGYNCTTGSDPTAVPCTTSATPTTAGTIAYCFNGIPFSPPGETGSRGTPAFWPGNATTPENYFYTVGSQDRLRAFQMQSNGTFGPAITQASKAVFFSYPGASPSVSWNSTTSDANSAIVWVLHTGGFATLTRAAKPAVLYAFAAIPSNGSLVRLWDSTTSGQTGPGAVKFVVPTVANGKIYVAGGTAGYQPNSSNCPINSTSCGQLTVYGP